MPIFGYPTDIRSQLSRKRLRLWLMIAFAFGALVITQVESDDTEEEDDTVLTETPHSYQPVK